MTAGLKEIRVLYTQNKFYTHAKEQLFISVNT